MGLILVGATLLLILMLTTLLGRGDGGGGVRDDEEDPEEDRPVGLEARVERFIGLLNYGDEQTATEAMRHLLSMGPGILPILFAHLSRLEQHPGGLAPRCQLMMEQVLVDFGLQTYLQCGDAIRAVHRASPVYPAVQRVLVGIGPNLLIELMRGPTLDPLVGMAPLFYRLAERIEHPLGELLDNRPEAIPPELLQAALPVFQSTPELLEALYTTSGPEARQRLMEVLAPWAPQAFTRHRREAMERPDTAEAFAVMACAEELLLPDADPLAVSARVARALRGNEAQRELALLRAATLPTPTLLQVLEEAPDALEPKLLTTLQELLDPRGAPREQVERALKCVGEEPEAARWSQWVGLIGLGARLDDPRAEARLLQVAEELSHPLGGLALTILAARPPEGLEDTLARRVRLARVTAQERFQLRMVAQRAPEHFEAILLRLLRADSARVVSLAALLLAPNQPPVVKLLKALGRHRGAPHEARVAPLLWSRWPACRVAGVGALKSDDREVREAAVAVLGSLGSEEEVPALLGGLGPESESVEARLNAVELLGPAGAERLAECMERDPEFAKSFALGRRLQLLRLLARRQGDAPND
ncbi:MAG: hypothetical protein CMH57_14685 [Myxococcales bacterium]|nr:hypothetical protein [Myxococcales bacterium]